MGSMPSIQRCFTRHMSARCGVKCVLSLTLFAAQRPAHPLLLAAAGLAPRDSSVLTAFASPALAAISRAVLQKGGSGPARSASRSGDNDVLFETASLASFRGLEKPWLTRAPGS